jgi:DNA polymerase III delta prime subunit
MARNKSTMPTIAEAGPLGAQRTRAVAAGYRKKVSEVRKSRTANRERLVKDVEASNVQQDSARSHQLQQINQTISQLEAAIGSPDISDVVREALQEQLAAERETLVTLESQIPILAELPPEESRAIPEKARVLESVEAEAARRERTADELIEVLYEGYQSRSSLESGVAQAIDQIYLQRGGEGSGIDELLWRQYVTNPEILSGEIRLKLKRQLNTEIANRLNSELTRLQDLPVATREALIAKLEERYRAPEKTQELIEIILAKPESSILNSYSVDQEIAELLLNEAVIQGADLVDLAGLMQLNDELIRNKFGSDNAWPSYNILAEALRFFRRADSQAKIVWRFPTTNKDVRAILEKVMGRAIEPGTETAEAFRDIAVRFVIEVNDRARKMVEKAEARFKTKDELENGSKILSEIVNEAQRSMTQAMETKRAEAQELLGSGLVQISMERESAVQLDHRLNRFAELIEPLIQELRDQTSPEKFIGSGLADRVSRLLKDLNDNLDSGHFSDGFFQSVARQMPSGYDYNGQGVANAVNSYLVDDNGRPNLSKLIPAGKSLAAEWENPDFAQIASRANRSLAEVIQATPNTEKIAKLFKGASQNRLEQQRYQLVQMKDDANRKLENFTSADRARFQTDVSADGEVFRRELRGLLEMKLKMAQSLYGHLLTLEVFSKRSSKRKICHNL